MTSTIRTTSTSWTTKELPEERIFRRIIAINLTTNGVPAGIRQSLVTPDVGDALLAIGIGCLIEDRAAIGNCGDEIRRGWPRNGGV